MSKTSLKDITAKAFEDYVESFLKDENKAFARYLEHGLVFEDGVWLVRRTKMMLDVSRVRGSYGQSRMHRRSAEFQLERDVMPLNHIHSLLVKRHVPATRSDILDTFRFELRDPSLRGVIAGVGLEAPGLFPPVWSQGFTPDVQAQIVISRGKLWLHGSDRQLWSRASLPKAYTSATHEEVTLAGDGQIDNVKLEELNSEDTTEQITHARILPVSLPLDDKVATQPRLLINETTAERLYPYINPFALYQLAVPPQRRDLAPPMEDFDYHCVYTKQDHKLSTVLDGMLRSSLRRKLDAHQLESVKYALTGDDTYIADDAGTGKTTSALAYAACIGASRTLIIGPSSAKYSWENEINATLAGLKTIHVLNAQDPLVRNPEQLRALLCGEFSWKHPAASSRRTFVVINYDILDRVIDVLNEVRWDLLIVDEAKRLQYDNSARSLYIIGGIKGKYRQQVRLPGLNAGKRLFMDGTPINKPFHFWPIVRAFDPQGLGADKVKFCDEYCGAYVDQMGRYQESGKTDLNKVRELGELCKQRFMVRHSDAVLNLKPCEEEVVFIEVEDRAALETDERNAILNALEKLRTRDKEGGDVMARQILSEVSKRGGGDLALREVVGDHFGEQLTNAQARGPLTAILLEEMATVRKKLGAAKVAPALKIIFKHWVDNAYDPILIFGHHKKEVVKQIAADLSSMMYEHLLEESHRNSEARRLLELCDSGVQGLCAEISGDVNAKRKADITARFQAEKLFAICANMAAAGEALTLTATNTVFFVETDWNATTMRQARKRAHRRGQQEQVRVYLLFVDQSFDYTVVSKFLLKRDVQDAFFGEGMWGGGSGDGLEDVDDD